MDEGCKFKEFAVKVLLALVLPLLFTCFSHAYEAMEVKNPGSIEGRVTYTGKAVSPKKVAVSKDQETCGHEPREVPRVETGPEGGLARAFVVLNGVEKGKPFEETSESALVDQKSCRFWPYTQIVRTGKPVKVRNSDPILHNIQATQEGVGLFNQAQPFQGLEFENIVEKPGPVQLQCNAHSWMWGYLWATDHPYAVATEEDGNFVLDGIPEGDYELLVWYPYLGEQTEKVTVKGSQVTKRDFEYTKRIRSRR
jgi:plastocyanin